MHKAINKKLIEFDNKWLDEKQTYDLRDKVDEIRDDLKKIMNFKKESIVGGRFSEFAKDWNVDEIEKYYEIINKDGFWNIIKNDFDGDGFDKAEQLHCLTTLYVKIYWFSFAKETQMKSIKDDWDNQQEKELLINSFQKEKEMLDGILPKFEKIYDIFGISRRLREDIITDEKELQKKDLMSVKENRKYFEQVEKV